MTGLPDRPPKKGCPELYFCPTAPLLCLSIRIYKLDRQKSNQITEYSPSFHLETFSLEQIALQHSLPGEAFQGLLEHTVVQTT